MVSFTIIHLCTAYTEVVEDYLGTSHQSVTRLTQTDGRTYTDIYRQFRVADLCVAAPLGGGSPHIYRADMQTASERQLLSKSGCSCWEVTRQILSLLKHFRNIFLFSVPRHPATLNLYTHTHTHQGWKHTNTHCKLLGF